MREEEEEGEREESYRVTSWGSWDRWDSISPGSTTAWRAIATFDFLGLPAETEDEEGDDLTGHVKPNKLPTWDFIL